MLPSPHAEPEQLDLELLRTWPLPVDPDGDKYSRGTVLVVGGSASTPGAAILAGMAALRMGAGKLQIATDPSVAGAIAIAVPESKVIALRDARGERSLPAGEIRDAMEQADCILIGPGMNRDGATTAVVLAALESATDSGVVVVDAAAIASLREIEPSFRERLRGRLVLTPNHQELDDLLQDRGNAAETSNDETTKQAMRAADEFGAVVVSFGIVCTCTGQRWQMAAGHPALGTSGSGDVRAGLVAGTAARSGDAAQAACWGTLVHALAGQRLGQRHGQLGFLAREIIGEIASVISSPA
jgi:ADP-dependent NAD(P)H-hydrate dehydratase